MNETNILKHVEVPHVNADFTEMYGKQMELQARLGQLPTSATHMAEKCIYWYFCVSAEIEELTEWLIDQKDSSWIIELKMEAVDIVHFVFNIGIEIGISDVDIFDIESKYEHSDYLIESERIRASIIILNRSLIKLINKLKWKTWKTYKESVDMQAVRAIYEEVIIATLILCNSCNLNKQAIINYYFAKNKVNHKRQDTGY